MITGEAAAGRDRLALPRALLFLALWILPPFWGIATLRTVNVQDDIFTSDLLNDRLPARAFVGASIGRRELPIWMPGIYTGFPSLAQVEIGALYPSNLVLFTLLDPYIAIAWAQLLPLFLAGLGCWLLADEYGLPQAARLLAAGSFALSGFLVVHLRQLNMVDAAAWLPFLVLATERIARGPVGRAPFALALLWMLHLLAGHPQIAFYTALVLAAYFLLRSRVGREGWLGARALPFALALVVGTLLAGAQLVPGLELAGLTRREGGIGLADATAYAADPRSFWSFFFPYVNGDPGDDSFHLSGLFWEQYGYLGLAPALLAIVALVVERRSALVRILGVIALVAWLLVLGKHTPVFPFAFSFVPGMSYFRFPTRFLLFVDLSLAILAGFGLAAVLRGIRSSTLRGVVAAAVIAATGADLWVHQGRQVPQAEFEEWTAPTWTERFLRERAGGQPWRVYTLDAAAVHGQTFHAARGWAGGPAPFLWLRSLLQPSSNLMAGLETPDGYSNLVPRFYERVWGSEKEPGIGVPSGEVRDGRWKLKPALLAALRLFNVRYVLAAQEADSDGLAEVGRSPGGIKVYEVRDPFPRAFVVGKVRAVSADDEAVRVLGSAGFDPAALALVEDAELRLPDGSAGSRQVDFVERRNTRVVLRARLAAPGLLVLSEGWYPGWRAWVDGTEKPVHRVNVMMRGVELAAGEHEVVFEFRSWSIRMGIAVSLLGLVLLAVLLSRGFDRSHE